MERDPEGFQQRARARAKQSESDARKAKENRALQEEKCQEAQNNRKRLDRLGAAPASGRQPFAPR